MNSRLFVFLLMLLISFTAWTAFPAAAQDEPLAPNSPLIIEMTDGKPIQLIFTAVGGETITVYARSLEDPEELDTTLEIIAPSGASIAENDDHDTDRMDLAQTDSLIADLMLAAAGDYTVIVDTFSGVAQGSIELLLTTDSAAQPTPEPTTPDGVGTGDEIVDGSVTPGELFPYAFSAEEGETVTITVFGVNGFDPRIRLVDSKGRVLAENDDHGTADQTLGRLDARIEAFSIVTSSVYTVEVSGFDNRGGDFTLEITRGTGSTPIEPRENALEVLQETINEGDVFTYALDARAGVVYTVSVQSLDDSFDPIVSIYDANDNLSAYNDDHGDPSADLARFDSRVTRWIVPFDGRYSVEVSGYQGGGGSFELRVETVAENAPTGLPDEQVYTGAAQDEELFSQTIELEAGDWVSITVRGLSGTFDPYVALLAPDGAILAENTDHGQRSSTLAFVDALIPNYPIAESGAYTINVLSESGVRGDFGITVSVRR